MRRVVRTWLEPFAMRDNEIQDLVLAVYEAVANAVEHAYRPHEEGVVEVRLWTEPGVVCIEVVDDGAWRPPTAAMGYRGRGIKVINRLVDSLTIRFDERGTRVLMRYRHA